MGTQRLRLDARRSRSTQCLRCGLVLPDAVDLLDERSREAYIGVLIHVAAADGDLVREESAAIEAAMGRANDSSQTARANAASIDGAKQIERVA